MSKRLPNQKAVIVTGASGIIGRHLVKDLKDQYYIYAFARRTQKAAHVPVHENICWMRLDISETEKVGAAIEQIILEGDADFLIHLAGYYDFGNEDNPEYQRTNVDGTRNMLEHARKLKLKRFIFSSSTTVTDFTKKQITVDENSPTDAKLPYARSKAKCEEIIKEYCSEFPCAILRLAAIFSDWCEYGPLYVFLSTWLSGRWNSQIIAGKGITSIPYLHIHDLNRLINRIMNCTEQLNPCPVYVAGGNGSTNHNELFEIAVRYNYGRQIKSIHIPKIIALTGVIFLDWIGRLLGNRPFERSWMIKYVDKLLHLDSTKTQEEVNWKPISRYHVLRRLLFLIENMKSNPSKWHQKNQEAILKTHTIRPNLMIYEVMINIEKEIFSDMLAMFLDPGNSERFKTYQQIEIDKLEKRLSNIYAMLKTAVRTGDRLHILSYAHNLAIEHFVEGFDVDEVTDAVEYFAWNIVQRLLKENNLQDLEQCIYDEIMLTTQLVVDEIQDSYERITGVD